MFELVVYKTQTGNTEDFSLLDTKHFNTFKQAETYADTEYDLSPVGDSFPGEYTNSNDTIGKIEEVRNMPETVYVAQVNVLQDSTQNSVEVFNTYAKAVVFIIEAMTESRDVWGEDELTQFIKENSWTDDTDYEVSVSEKSVG